MPTRIRFRIEGQDLAGELDDTETARTLAARLPISIRMSRWGDEYYGSLGEALKPPKCRDARDEMSIGELAWWPPGNALCVFFGPTPASRGDEPRAASPVVPVGRLTGDTSSLRKLGPSARATVEAEEPLDG
jgi:uncharacterized protein